MHFYYCSMRISDWFPTVYAMIALKRASKGGIIMGYLLHVTLDGSDPIIERNIIVPQEATFKQLHDIIQNTTNFKSGYPYGGYHLYEFQIEKENVRITDDEESHLQHEHYVQNPDYYKERLDAAVPDHKKFVKSIYETYAVKTRYPNELIKSYLKKHKTLVYEYDFGDGWTFNVELLQTIKHYNLEYAILISGNEDAPPEDVGGLGGFDDFKNIMKDPNHPEYESYKQWSSYQGFEKFNIDKANKRLKKIKIKAG